MYKPKGMSQLSAMCVQNMKGGDDDICYYMKRVIKFNIYQCYIHVGNKSIDDWIS